MTPFQQQLQSITRRHFFQKCQVGVGAMALSSLLAAEGQGAQSLANPLAPKQPHYPAKARNVIYLHMAGSPPQLDLFDYKPKLKELSGKPCPEEYTKGERFPFIKGTPKLLGSPHKFYQVGERGTWMSELLPNMAKMADDLTIVRSMYTEQFNHAPAQLLMYTGSPRIGQPSMGTWITYGLGSENQNLPGYVVMISGGSNPSAGKTAWGSGFLPSVYQGVQCRSKGEPVLYVNNPPGMNRKLRRRGLDALAGLNELQQQQSGDPETKTRIAQYELAYRMQIAVPEVMDINRESQATLDDYGAKPGEGSFANNCLLARRLVEKGVRFVQLFDWGWDYHGTAASNDIKLDLPGKVATTEKAYCALLRDLKQRGLLEDTLVVWGGEFGRTPMNEERNGSKFLGRDHHPHAFTTVLAGGGIKPGVDYGATDELGYFAAEDRMHVHDLQATILHLLGLDPFKFSYPYQGLDQRLIGPTEKPKLHPAILA